mgnify:CR=1 FL=1
MLFRSAAKGGSANGCYNLARLIETGAGGLGEANPKGAFEYFEKAARMGHGPAQNNLGLMYQTGTGVKADLEEAGGTWRQLQQWAADEVSQVIAANGDAGESSTVDNGEE